jgi:hypothetical protein
MPRTSRTLARALRRSSRGQGQPKDAGAAAVEFALVLPILILILFGIIDYGLYFNASLQSRWGVHDAARTAAVSPLAGSTSCTTTVPPPLPADVKRLICGVLAATDSATAKKYIDVRLPEGWVVGKQLVVCERLDVAGLTGLVPLPGSIKDVAVLTIETDDPTWPDSEKKLAQDYEDVLPNGGSWDAWCKP